MRKDYYKILGVTKGADDATIKKAFRKLAKQYHPDTNGGNAEAAKKFQEINEAYSVLSDEEKRKAYDEDKGEQQNTSSNASSSAAKKTTHTANPFAGFTQQNFKMDFGDMMFDEINKKKKTENDKNAGVNLNDVSEQFASFFGFRPK